MTDHSQTDSGSSPDETPIHAFFEQTRTAAVLCETSSATILELNPAAATLLARRPGEARGRPLAEMLGAAQSEGLLEQLKHPRPNAERPKPLIVSTQGGRSVRVEIISNELEVGGRQARWIELRESSPKTDDNGRQQQMRAMALQELTAGLARTTGHDFFPELASRLADLLGARCVVVAEWTNAAEKRIRFLAASGADCPSCGKVASLGGTPLEPLLEEDAFDVTPDASKGFSFADCCESETATEIVGVALRDANGVRIGLITATFENAANDSETVIEMLRLFGIRAAAELERLRSLELARRNEERFRTLAKATSDTIWDWDVADETVWRSEGFSSKFGTSDQGESVPFDAFIEGVHPEDRERIRASLRTAVEGGDEFWQEDFRFVRRDGEYAFVLDRAIIIRDATGRALRMVGGMTDFSERADAATRFRDQAELLDLASDAIIVRDLEDRIVFWNQSAEHLYGWTAREAVGRPAKQLLSMKDKNVDTLVSQVMEHGDWSGEFEIEDKAGHTRIVYSRWTLVREPTGEPRAVLNIDTDITGKKQLEAQYLRAQRLESIGILAGGIAHDLNNMLTPITMAVSVLRRIHPDEDSAELIDTIADSTRRGADLVRQVLGFARGVEGKRMSVNPGFIVRDIARIARDTFPKNIRLRTEAARGSWLVLGDPTQLQQVVLNLCVNARDAMPSGGDLRITAANVTFAEPVPCVDGSLEPGDYVVLSVSDTGSGISKESLEKVFDPFFTTKEPGKGTGLGLSTALAIARSHGGSLQITTEPGAGSTFRVVLPAELQELEGAGTAKLEEPPRGDGEWIIVVDDETYIRTIAKQTLEAFGYNVVECANGTEALAAYLENRDKISLVLTDTMMPIMDGPALIRALLRLDTGIRIIAASGTTGDPDLEKTFTTGNIHFLAKPYHAESMLWKVAEVLHPAE